jgi:plastocyanin
LSEVVLKEGAPLNANRKTLPYKLLALLAALVLALAACGGGDDEGGDEGDGGGDSTTEPTSVEVSAADFSFSPSTLEVEPGAEVEVSLVNTGEAPHTMTSEDLGLDIEAQPGATADGTFTAPESGSVEFQCNFHPQMKGTISVGGEGESSDAGGEPESGKGADGY